MTDKLFEKAILKTAQRHVEKMKFLHASQFSFMHTTAQHFNVWGLRTTQPKISVIICLLLWYSWISKKFLILDGTLFFLYTLCNLQFLPSIIKPTSVFLSNRKFRVSVEGKMSTPEEIQVHYINNYFKRRCKYAEKYSVSLPRFDLFT